MTMTNTSRRFLDTTGGRWFSPVLHLDNEICQQPFCTQFSKIFLSKTLYQFPITGKKNPTHKRMDLKQEIHSLKWVSTAAFLLKATSLPS